MKLPLRFGSRLAAMFAALALPASVLCAHAGVLLVGPPGSGAPYTQIQPAVDAAQPGDTVHVLPGSYREFVVTKPVRVLGAGSALVSIDAVDHVTAVAVIGVPAGTEAVISGMQVHAFEPYSGAASVLQGNAGTVVLHDLEFEDVDNRTAILVEDSARVVLEAANIRAGTIYFKKAAVQVSGSELWISDSVVIADTSYFTPILPVGFLHALYAEDATVRIWNSHLEAGDSEFDLSGGAIAGGYGIRLIDSELDLRGGPLASVQGGDGGQSFSAPASAPGGAGISLEGASTATVQSAVPIQGGLAGDGGSQAPPVLADASSSFAGDAQTHPRLTPQQAQVAPGAGVTLEAAGSNGGTVFVFGAVGTETTPALGGILGVPYLDPGGVFSLSAIGLDASGGGVTTLAVPPIPTLSGAFVHLQGIELGATPGFTNPSGLAVL